MTNFGNLLGAFLQSGTAPSMQNRVGNALGNLQQEASNQQGGGVLGGLLGAMQGGLGAAAQNPAAAGGVGALLGSLLGGGGSSVKGAVGGGALAMLAGVAMKALAAGGQSTGMVAPAGDAAALAPAANPTPEQEQAVERRAKLVVKGMINAAKSDGHISPEEMQRIVGKLRESGMDEGSQAWVMAELSKPLDVDAFAAEIPDPEAAAEVYAASLLAIEVDTQAERRYLSRLAQASGLDPAVAQFIEQTMGVAQ